MVGSPVASGTSAGWVKLAGGESCSCETVGIRVDELSWEAIVEDLGVAIGGGFGANAGVAIAVSSFGARLGDSAFDRVFFSGLFI